MTPDVPEPSAFDPARYKADQRRAWSRVAAGWSRWWETFERAAQRVSDRLVELARLEPGGSVLDVATGIGEPAVTAALRVGPTGHVIAVDQAPQMLAVARQRMASLGLTNVEFLEMDAESLDLPERAFDAILSRWGLMFLPDLDRALARMLRLLVPGGRLAAAVWGEAPRVPLISLAQDVLREALQAPPPPGSPTPFDLADEAALGRRLERARFKEIGAERLTVTFEFASPADYVRFVREVAAPPPALEELPPERLEEIWSSLVAAAARHAAPDGSLRLANEALLVTGRRPSGSSAAEPPPEEIARSPATGGAGPGPPELTPASREPVRCPFCRGRRTRLESAFGSTIGFAQYWCDDCRTVFEHLKWEDLRSD